MAAPTAKDEQFSEQESERRYQATLEKVLASPPHHKAKLKPGTSPKKRGRPPKETPARLP